LSDADPPPRTVLMVHGAGGGGWEFNTWSRVFSAAGWQVRAPDLAPVAHGLAATRFDDYRAQVAHWIDASPHPRVLVGASLGGLLALRCAAAADALVLVNPLLPAPWHALLPALPPCGAIEPWGARASLDGTRRALPDAGAGEAWFAFRRWRDESGAVLDVARRGVECPVPRCPVLVVASRRDADVPFAASRRFAQAYEATLHVVDDASHVGVLFGRQAARAAVGVVTWLNVKIA
jgi:pimeloyl-ACP methyl ester carboxylesterase